MSCCSLFRHPKSKKTIEDGDKTMNWMAKKGWRKSLIEEKLRACGDQESLVLEHQGLAL